MIGTVFTFRDKPGKDFEIIGLKHKGGPVLPPFKAVTEY
jgi:hypothetical protein